MKMGIYENGNIYSNAQVDASGHTYFEYGNLIIYTHSNVSMGI